MAFPVITVLGLYMIIDSVLECAKSGKIMHAIMVAGIDKDERLNLARSIASAFCLERIDTKAILECPDYKEIGSSRISVDDIRDLNADTAVEAFGKGRRCYCVNGYLGMSVQTQNVLLKTLEEPPKDTLIIICGQESSFLPTIRSRSVIIRIGSQDPAAVSRSLVESGIDSTLAWYAACWSNGCAGLAKRFADPAYSEFRKQCGYFMELSMFGLIPFNDANKFAEQDPVFPDMVPALAAKDNEDQDGEGKDKKRKNMSINIPMMLDVFTDILRDAMVEQEGFNSYICPDAVKLSGKIALNFTKKGILSMIDKLMEYQKNMRFNVRPKLMLDAALVVLSDKEYKKQSV